MKKIFLVGFMLANVAANAQMHSHEFNVQWSIFTPLSDKEYIENTSTAGMRFGYTKFVNDQWAFGIDVGYNSLHEYIPRATYVVSNGAYTTDFYHYLYYYSVLGHARYNFVQTERFIPYASLGMGVSFGDYRIYYNVYESGENKTGFLVRPEVGTSFKIKEYSNWALKVSACYDYATIKSETFDINNLSGIAVQVGVVFFTD